MTWKIVFGFSFGHNLPQGGVNVPGISNEDLADAEKKLDDSTSIDLFYNQFEVASALKTRHGIDSEVVREADVMTALDEMAKRARQRPGAPTNLVIFVACHQSQWLRIQRMLWKQKLEGIRIDVDVHYNPNAVQEWARDETAAKRHEYWQLARAAATFQIAFTKPSDLENTATISAAASLQSRSAMPTTPSPSPGAPAPASPSPAIGSASMKWKVYTIGLLLLTFAQTGFCVSRMVADARRTEVKDGVNYRIIEERFDPKTRRCHEVVYGADDFVRRFDYPVDAGPGSTIRYRTVDRTLPKGILLKEEQVAPEVVIGRKKYQQVRLPLVRVNPLAPIDLCLTFR